MVVLMGYDLVLVHMPFGSLSISPLSMGVLLAAAKKNKLSVKGFFPGFHFINLLGYEFYNILHRCTMEEGVGNLLFSHEIFRQRDRIIKYIEEFVSSSREKFDADISNFFGSQVEIAELVDILLEKTTFFLEKTAAQALDWSPSIVACSASVNQHVASLALLKRIKKFNPGITTIMGGPSVWGKPGLATVKSFPWVDYVFSGEGDDNFVKFCEDILKHKGSDLRDLLLPLGALSAAWEGKLVPVARVSNLEALPPPDFHDYCDALASSGLQDKIRPILTYESARGCWKGKASLCSFCSLNYDTVEFRTKSAAKVLREVLELKAEYGISDIYFTESIINMSIFKDLLPTLTSKKANLALFFQVPSKLSWIQIQKMASAGVMEILPGIENLQDDLLKLMNKNNSAIDNIALLKYAAQVDMIVSWNLLAAIPGERPEFYDELTALLPLLFHLSPPQPTDVLFQRDAFYWRHAEELHLDLKPIDIYDLIYPGMAEFVEDFADSFEAVNHDELFASTITGRTRLGVLINEWQTHGNSVKQPSLTMVNCGKDGAVIIDARPCAARDTYKLTEQESLVYCLLWEPLTFSELQGLLFLKGWEGRDSNLQDILDGFIAAKIAVSMKDMYLGLAVDRSVWSERSQRNFVFRNGSLSC
jgi:magnesium-protoporphyrin IX monomethyl ester (oxidative) cyclase